MPELQKDRVVEAVEILIGAVNYSKLINEMTGILESWHDHPMIYSNHLAPLNELLDIGIKDRVAFERVVRLVEQKRKLVPESYRVDYQREYMAARRGRLARAVELKQLQSGPFRSPVARKDYERGVTERWRKARDAFVKAKGELSWTERNAAASEFWAGIDATMETNLAAERAKLKG